MLKNTVFLAALLVQTLPFAVALPSPSEEEVKVAAAEDGHPNDGDHGHDHDGGDNFLDCDITIATVTDYIPG